MPPSRRRSPTSAFECDQVFAILTSGPFPTGKPSDVGVESHLRRCPSCREIAEALRPADERVAEPLSPDESGSLPMYVGALGADANTWRHGEATLVSSAFDYRIRDQLPQFKQHRAAPVDMDIGTNLLRFVSAALGGLLVISVLMGLGILPRRDAPAVPAVEKSPAPQLKANPLGETP